MLTNKGQSRAFVARLAIRISKLILLIRGLNPIAPQYALVIAQFSRVQNSSKGEMGIEAQ